MTYSYIIAIDQGTHSTRAIIYNENGTDIYHAKRSIDLFYSEKYNVEQDGVAILESCRQVLNEAHHYIQERQLKNVAIALTTQRSTIIAWHSKSGAALSPALSWLDTRAKYELYDLNLCDREIRSKTGLKISPHYGASKIQWLLANNKKVQNALQNDMLLIGPLASFIVFNLVKNNPSYVDYSNAHRTLLWNIHTHEWDDALLEAFSIDSSILPIPVANKFNFGLLAGYDYPLVLMNGDQNSALYAYGNLQSDTAFVNIGTGGFILANSQQQVSTESNLLYSITYSSDSKQEYAMEGTINGAGASLTWAKDHWGIDNIQALPWNEVTDVPIFINSVGGLGSPWWKSDIAPRFLENKKTYIDYSQQQCKAALMESIVFLIVNNLDEMRKFNIHPKTLMVSGGLSADKYLCQRLADLCSIPVIVSDYKEATSRGAAWLAMSQPDWNLPSSGIIQAKQDSALTLRYQKFTKAIKQYQLKHRLIAHRGDMTCYPENSMRAIQAAVNLGLSNVEIDIQFSKDGVPIVIHDDNLLRTTGSNKNIRDLNAKDISTYLLNNVHQLSDDLTLLNIPSLNAVVNTLNKYPEMTLFVELKRQSIEHFGSHLVVDAVLHQLKQAKFKIVVISFVADVISLVQSRSLYSVGFVISEFNQAHQDQAEHMQPDYLFCNINKISSPETLWDGQWQWALYDIQDPQLACKLLNQGVALIETGDIVKLANAKELN
jgi:glycerol kinase